MKCPFLRECRVKFCQVAPVRKLIEETSGSANEICGSHRYHECITYRNPQKGTRGLPPSSHCPFLQETQAQFCALAPAVRFIAGPGDSLSRCNSENHRFCSIYLAERQEIPDAEGGPAGIVPRMPDNLYYARNHMWLDFDGGKDCHIGFDGLLTSVLGRIQKLSFIKGDGERCPSVVLTAHDVPLHMVFPNPMKIICSNAQLRANPELLCLDPYGAGWLFEGEQLERTDIRTGLLSRAEARLWMEEEVRRVSGLIDRLVEREPAGGRPLAADGGVPVEGAAGLLRPEALSRFYEILFDNQEAK